MSGEHGVRERGRMSKKMCVFCLWPHCGKRPGDQRRINVDRLDGAVRVRCPRCGALHELTWRLLEGPARR